MIGKKVAAKKPSLNLLNSFLCSNSLRGNFISQILHGIFKKLSCSGWGIFPIFDELG